MTTRTLKRLERAEMEWSDHQEYEELGRALGRIVHRLVVLIEESKPKQHAQRKGAKRKGRGK